MNEKENVRKELEKHAPFLAKLKKEQNEGFEVHPTYFKELQSDLIEHARQLESQPGWWEKPMERLNDIFNFLVRPRMVISLVLSGFALLALFHFGFEAINPGGKQDPFAELDLTEAEILSYVNHHIDEFDTDLILHSLGQEVNIRNISVSDFSEEDLEEVYDLLLDDLELHEIEELF